MQGALREEILEALRDLFRRRGYRHASVREIASHAGTSVAMISYYFGGKRGLYSALLQDTLGRLIAVFEPLAAANVGHSPHAFDARLHAFVRAFATTIRNDPWIPQIMLREVFSDAGELRDAFLSRLAPRLAPGLVDLIAQGVRESRVDPRLDPRMLVLSLMGLVVYPHVAGPVVGGLLGVERALLADPDRFAHHTVRVFLEGARPVSPADSPARPHVRTRKPRRTPRARRP